MPNESRSSMAKKRRTPPALNRLENASEMFLLAATGSQQRIPFPAFLFRRQLPRRPRHPSCRHTGGWGPERHGPTYPVLPPSFVPYSSFFLWTWLESVASRSGRLGGTRNAVPATALGAAQGGGGKDTLFPNPQPSSQVSTRCVSCRATWCSCSAPRRARGVLLSCRGRARRKVRTARQP
jgi:hypothetical protein